MNTYFLPLASYYARYLLGTEMTEYFWVVSYQAFSLNFAKTFSEIMTAAMEVPSETERLYLSI